MVLIVSNVMNWIISMYLMLMMRVIVKVIMVIKFISVLMGLVSITPGHVKLDWLPPPKVDRVNDNNSENNNE